MEVLSERLIDAEYPFPHAVYSVNATSLRV